ncbi:MAG: hypothetical protein ACK5IP_03280 [Paracoccus sp. (in: a-proteobacteria)]
MYSKEVTWQQYLLTWEESQIEEALLKDLGRDSQDEIVHRSVDQYKSALREIDRLKVSGEYDNVRNAALMAIRADKERQMDSDPKYRARVIKIDATLRQSDGEIDRQIRNLSDGLRSPDPAQAKRFKQMYDAMELGSKAYPEIRKLLPALERAKRRKGRAPLPTPWTNEIEHMDVMRLLVASGMTIPLAARERAISEGRADAGERAKTLAKLYRQRADLRN